MFYLSVILCLILQVTSEIIDFHSISNQNLNAFEIDQDETELPLKAYNSIPDESRSDYPTLNGIPKTSFTCEGKVESGYYADIETNCQVFHICLAGGHKTSFLCPNGSIFNEKYSVCDWWYSFDCNQISNEIFVPIQRDVQGNEYQQPSFQYVDLNIASSGGNNEPNLEEKNSRGDSKKSGATQKASNERKSYQN